MALKIIPLDIDDSLTGDTRVEEIALVLQPAIETEFVYFKRQDFQDTFNDYPQGIKDTAKRAKDWVEENGYGSCMTPVGKARLNQLANGEPISLETVKRMYSYLSRHKKDLESSKSYDDGCGKLAYDAWGGEAGLSWSERIVNRQEMGYDTKSLEPYVQTTGTTKMEVIELDIFGYRPSYFHMCPGAIATFQELVSSKNTEDTIGMIRSAAVVADKIFQIEEEVIQRGKATAQELRVATLFVDDFKDIISEVGKLQNKTYDVSYMDNHIKKISQYMNENMEGLEDACWEGYEAIGMKIVNGREVPNCVPKENFDTDCGCDCGDCSDLTPDQIMYGDGEEEGLYFEENYIDGKPVFESVEEAEKYAEEIGCKGSHKHIVDGKEYYMPCEIHTDLIDKLLEDRGLELEDLLKEYEIVDVEYADPEKLRKELKEKFSTSTYEEFYQIITKPGDFSRLDYGNRTRRFVYMTGFGPELMKTSRNFCRRMLGGRQYVFRIEDIEMLNAQITAEDSDYKIIPRPKGTSPDIFAYKGGANCRHYWMEVILQPRTPYDVAPTANNNKRQMIEEAAITLPADAQAGQTNPPVDYGSRSPASVGFRKNAGLGIIVDVDNTLVKGNKPVQKTIDYINKKWDNHRIIVVSGRPKSRTEETKRELDRAGVRWDEIYLSDFPIGPNSSRAFKEYKAKELQKQGVKITQAIDDDSEARRLYTQAGIKSMSPSSFKSIPSGFLQGLAIFPSEKEAQMWSEEMGCGGIVEPVEYMGERQFQACSYKLKKEQMRSQFTIDKEKRMLYSPAMKPGILIPRIDELTQEKYFVTFTPETIEKMAQRFLIEKRTDKTNYEHSEQKFDGVYLVESWIVNGEQDKAYTLGYTKQQIPKGTWFVGYRIDNDEVWSMIKKGQVKGLSIEGNFEYKLSAINMDDYLLEEIINIINKIEQ